MTFTVEKFIYSGHVFVDVDFVNFDERVSIYRFFIRT